MTLKVYIKEFYMLGDVSSRPLVTIEYCVPWDYVPQAVGLAEKIMELFSWDINGVTLIPADGGAFEVSVGGVLMYSKLKQGQFPDQKQLVDQIREQLL